MDNQEIINEIDNVTIETPKIEEKINIVTKKRGRPSLGLSPEELLKRDRESMAKSQIIYREKNPEVYNKASKKYYAKKKAEDPVWYENYKENCRIKMKIRYDKMRKKINETDDIEALSDVEPENLEE
jgi:hypothetical protein